MILPSATLALAVLAASPAQTIDLGDFNQPRPAHAQRVTFDPTPLTVTAGKPDWIELRFQVQPRVHVNSHAPHDELLIPTTLRLATSPQLRLLTDEYPAGKPLHLNIGAGETLSTYEGPFRIRLQVLAPKGETTLTGTLHYQACDTAACFPPRDLPVSVPLSAR